MHRPARNNVSMRRASLLLVVVAFLSSPATLAGAPEEFGFSMMPSAHKIGPHRYQSDRNYDATVKFFREKFRSFKAVRWMREVSLPGVKYIHAENDNTEAGWDGINISLMPDGTVHVFVLERQKPAAAASSSAPSSKP
jgi:hypothetical protein